MNLNTLGPGSTISYSSGNINALKIIPPPSNGSSNVCCYVTLDGIRTPIFSPTILRAPSSSRNFKTVIIENTSPNYNLNYYVIGNSTDFLPEIDSGVNDRNTLGFFPAFVEECPYEQDQFNNVAVLEAAPTLLFGASEGMECEYYIVNTSGVKIYIGNESLPNAALLNQKGTPILPGANYWDKLYIPRGSVGANRIYAVTETGAGDQISPDDTRIHWKTRML